MDWNRIEDLAKSFDSCLTVPDSTFKQLYRRIRTLTFSTEQEALGVAAGLWLGGKNSLLVIQNTGLARISGDLLSLNRSYGIPVFLLIGHRGVHGDSPEHSLLGAKTRALLEILEIPHLTARDLVHAQCLANLHALYRNRQTVALLVEHSPTDERGLIT